MEENIALKPEKVFNTADIGFAFVMLACGFLYWNLIDFFSLGAGVTLFAAVLFGASFIYLSKSKIKGSRWSFVPLLLAGLCALQFALFDNRVIRQLNFLFLSALFIYWICLSTGRRIDKKLSVYIAGDAVKQIMSIPFLNFGCCASGVKSFSKYGKIKAILPAIIGIVLFLPLLLWVLYLLWSADLAFEKFINSAVEVISVERLITYAVQFVIGIPVAFYLYGSVYGNVKGRHAECITAESVDNAAKAARFAPRAAIYSILTAFNAIYLLFFGVQAAYLFSAFGGDLPEVFSYAEYARRGFFELCAVAGINLGVLLVSHLTVKRNEEENPRALRVETLLISLFTILLIATALSKMVMYINAYGLTQLRVFTSWFMILLLFVFVVICVRQFKKFNSSRLIILGFVLMFMALSYGNIDGVIAKYNIERYEAGTLSTFDADMLAGLSDAAVPHIYDMYLRTGERDSEMRERLKSAIMMSEWVAGGDSFREFNLQKHRADEIRALLNEEQIQAKQGRGKINLPRPPA